MKIQPKQRLFWFLKEDALLDLDKASDLDLYVQQVFSRGRTEDVTQLLKEAPQPLLNQSFQRVKAFLAGDVRNFWEDFFIEQGSPAT